MKTFDFANLVLVRLAFAVFVLPHVGAVEERGGGDEHFVSDLIMFVLESGLGLGLG